MRPGAQLTLAWLEIDARWPGASVMWDRDVAPGLDFDPAFREIIGHLWAFTYGEPSDLCHRSGCVCRVWDGEAWLDHAEGARRIDLTLRIGAPVPLNELAGVRTPHDWHLRTGRRVANCKECSIGLLNDDLRNGRIFIAGTPWPATRDLFHDDRVDALTYAYGWAQREHREMERHRWALAMCRGCGSQLIAGACSNLGCFAENPN